MLPATNGGTQVFGAFQGEKMTHPAGQMFDPLVGLQAIKPKSGSAPNNRRKQVAASNYQEIQPGEFPDTPDAELRKPVKRLKPSESRRRLSLVAGRGLGRIKTPAVDLIDKWEMGNREVFVSEAVTVIVGEGNNGMQLGHFLAKLVPLMINLSKIDLIRRLMGYHFGSLMTQEARASQVTK
jgi:hypothetical protein